MKMEKFRYYSSKVFQFIYFIFLMIYIVILPIIVMAKFRQVDSDIFIITEFRTNFCLKFSLIVFIVFIIECLINRERIKQILSRKVIFFLLAFLLWCFISTLLSSNYYDSFHGVMFRYNGFIEFLSYTSFVILGFCLNENFRKIFLRIFFIVSIIMGVLVLLNSKYNFGIFLETGIVAIFYNINHYGYYLVYSIIVSMFFIIYDKNYIIKILDIIGYSLLVYLLVINDTFGCYIAILFTLAFLVFYILKYKMGKKLVFILCLPFILISCFSKYEGRYVVYDNFHTLVEDLSFVPYVFKGNSISREEQAKVDNIGNYRYGIWSKGIKYTFEKPFFGYGLENLTERYHQDFIDIDIPHNIIIQLSSTVGIVGMLLCICSYLFVLFRGLKYTKSSDIFSLCCYFVLFGRLISAMFGLTVYYVTPYFMIIFGMCIRSLKNKMTYMEESSIIK